jgi:hypothetical protein
MQTGRCRSDVRVDQGLGLLATLIRDGILEYATVVVAPWQGQVGSSAEPRRDNRRTEIIGEDGIHHLTDCGVVSVASATAERHL